MARKYTPAKKGLTIADLQTQVASDVISMLKQDGLTWFQRWATPRSPLNGVSGHVYSGTNVLTTSLWLMLCDSDDPRFISASSLFAKDPAKNVATVRKGEKGIPIVVAGATSKTDEDTGEKISRPFFKVHRVWHISQLDNIQEDKLVSKHLHAMPTNPAERDVALDAFFSHTGATLTETSTAHYNPRTDTIGMPAMNTFRHNTEASASEYYYATLLHELIHWTGAPHRLNRPSLANYTKDKTERAREELIAELGAVMAGMHLGLQPKPREDNASYIQGWVSLLEEKPSAIFDAASAAGKALHYLEGLQPKLHPQEEEVMA